jgi:dephospho-CoA kinase
MKPCLVGITGRIASGKSVAADYISQTYQFHLIDADKVGHQILEEQSVMDAIAHRFPSAFDSSTNSIQRAILSDLVFQDPKKLRELNAITWAGILTRIASEIGQYPRSVIEAIGLFQSSLYKKCDCTLYINCSFLHIQKRLQMRGLTDDKIQRIILAQKDHAASMSLANVVITNNSSLQDFRESIDQTMNSLFCV